MKKIGKILSVMVAVSLSFFALSCVEPKDTDAPAEVTNFTVNTGNGQAVLRWTNPGDSDFAGTKLSMQPAVGELAQEKTLASDVTTFTVTGLTDGKSYAFTIKTFDKSGNTSFGRATADFVRDTIAPDEISNVSFVSESGKIILSWENPGDSDFEGCKVSMSPTVKDFTEAKTLEKNVSTLEVTGLTNGTSYSFTIQTFDANKNVSEGKTSACIAGDTSFPLGYVKVAGGTITGKTNTNNFEGVFIAGRSVTLSDFYISRYEVTQDEYESLMTSQTVTVEGNTYTLEAKPSYCKANSIEYAVKFGTSQGRRPVEGVTWYDAVYFCNAKSAKEGLTPAYNITVTSVDSNNHITAADVSLVANANGYRLPTEAEWEYAARGGNPDTTNEKDWDYVFSGADTKGQTYGSGYPESDSVLDEVGWYCYNNITGGTSRDTQTFYATGRGTHKVGKKKANRLGLYDMSGNVWEWCYNWYDAIDTGTATNPAGPASADYHRAIRGGSWYYYANDCTVSNRYFDFPSDCDYYLGFRVVRSSS